MKKILLGAVSLIAMATTASAADLAARPYTKAAPMVADVQLERLLPRRQRRLGIEPQVLGHDHFRRRRPSFRTCLRVATMHRAAPSAARSAIAGRPRPGCSAWKHRATGLISRAPTSAFSYSPATKPRSTLSASSPARSATPGTTRCCTSRAARRVTSDKYTGFTTAGAVVPVGTAFNSASETRWGATVGVGLEYGFTPNWSFGVEYNHMFMGDRDIALASTGAIAPAGASIRTDRIRQDVDMVTARINYRLGGPVVARY